jgi:biopolymer transport protein ExbD
MKMRRQQSELRLELTPLIDVIFLLLTFFIFAMILMIRADVLDVSLPTLGSAGTSQPGVAITVAVTADGSVAVDGQPVPIEELVETLKASREKSPDARLLLAVDQTGRTGDMLAVTDALIGAGITDFSVLATPGDGPRATTPRGE